MDILIISNENNILHVFNQGYVVDYTIYNCKGHNLDGGVLESSKGKFENDLAINEIVKIIKENYGFNLPFMYLKGEQAESLLELIEAEDLKNTQSKVDDYLSTIKKSEIHSEIEKEI